MQNPNKMNYITTNILLCLKKETNSKFPKKVLDNGSWIWYNELTKNEIGN